MAKRIENQKGGDQAFNEPGSANSLTELIADVILENIIIKNRLKARLKSRPNGFHLQGMGLPCQVCHSVASGENCWYDSYGVKCMRCQTAINRKELPPTVATKKDTYYTELELKVNFGLYGGALKEFIRTGILRVRILNGDLYHSDMYFFFVRDNKEFLPPKRLVKDQKLTVTIDGIQDKVTVPWYQTKNPHDRLKNYGINKYLDFKDEDQQENP